MQKFNDIARFFHCNSKFFVSLSVMILSTHVFIMQPGDGQKRSSSASPEKKQSRGQSSGDNERRNRSQDGREGNRSQDGREGNVSTKVKKHMRRYHFFVRVWTHYMLKSFVNPVGR